MKPISEMTPLEIREAVATRVMGLPWVMNGSIPTDGMYPHLPYESSVSVAFDVVAKMREKGYHFEMEYGPGENSVCCATFSMYGSRGHARLLPVPLAIAAAALEAIGSAK